MGTPTRRTVIIHGHELSYLDSGTGSVVLWHSPETVEASAIRR